MFMFNKQRVKQIYMQVKTKLKDTWHNGFLASSYKAHSVVTKVVSEVSIIDSHTNIISCSSLSVLSSDNR